MRRHPGDTEEGDNVRSHARLYTEYSVLIPFLFQTPQCLHATTIAYKYSSKVRLSFYYHLALL